jgi:type IV pilus assembly protein PilM
MPVPKKNQLIGIDIGSYSIKIAEIQDTKRGMVLKNFGIIKLPPDAIVEGSIREMGIVSEAIKNLLKNLKIKNKNVATSISGYSIIVKKIIIPWQESKELEKTIQNEAEQYIPFDINDVNLDYQILTSENEEEQQERDMDVLLVAAKKDIVEEYTNLFRLIEYNPVVLDIDAFALQNTFEISDKEQSGCNALAHIGSQQLTINIIKDGVSIFTRDSSHGGNQVTNEIKRKLNVSYQEAEKIKLGAISVEKKQMLIVEEIFTSTIAKWVREIRRALDFVTSTFSDVQVENIFLSGGSSLIPGFPEYLGLETGLKIETLNPFANLEVNNKLLDPDYLKYIAPIAVISVGLALRSIDDR